MNDNYNMNGYQGNGNDGHYANYNQGGYMDGYQNGGYQGGGYYTAAPSETLGEYMAQTYAWMFVGLLTTFILSFVLFATGYIVYLFVHPYLVFVLTAVELVLVIALSARINKMAPTVARMFFITYAVLNGIVFSLYFLMYDMESMILAFGGTALFFGVMTFAGYVIKADLSGLGSVLRCGLIALIIFWIASIFVNLTAFETLACTVGMFIFMLLTAYDTQKIKEQYHMYAADGTMLKKASIISALQLYLDFINLFLYILRLVGKRNN